jgi:hypothetical protein
VEVIARFGFVTFAAPKVQGSTQGLFELFILAFTFAN